MSEILTFSMIALVFVLSPGSNIAILDHIYL